MGKNYATLLDWDNAVKAYKHAFDLIDDHNAGEPQSPTPESQVQQIPLI